jgi:hypothetical protein
MFVLKGGMLLAVLDARRPTADADLLARSLPNNDAAVLARVREIAQTVVDEEDGVEFLVDTISAESIREGDLYAGTRVSMTARVSTATVKLNFIELTALEFFAGDAAGNLLNFGAGEPRVASVHGLG